MRESFGGIIIRSISIDIVLNKNSVSYYNPRSILISHF